MNEAAPAPAGSSPAPAGPSSGLAALGGMTQEIDGANLDPGAKKAKDDKEARERALDLAAREWAQLPFLIGGAVCMLAPELAEVYTEKRCLEWGRGAAAVADKYGWKTTSMPEVALLASTAGLAVPTVLTIRQRLAMMQDAKEAGMLGKIALWWRARKLAKDADAQRAKAAGGTDAGQQ